MRTATVKRAWRAFKQAPSALPSRVITVMILSLLAATGLSAATTVNWLSGGPNNGFPSGAGYSDGDITLEAEYHTPCGLAMDSSGNFLFLADRDNNAVRLLEFDDNSTFTIAVEDQNGNAIPNLFIKPVGVALDPTGNFLYVLNRGNGFNGNVLEVNLFEDTVATNLTKITNASGIALDLFGNTFVTASNQVFKITPSNVSSLVATVTASGASLAGIVCKHNGLLAVCDAGRNGILLIDPGTGNITTNAGFHGAGDFFSANNIASSNNARFFQPSGVVEAGDGTLIVSDYGNSRVKVVLTSGTVTNLYGVTNMDWISPYPGFMDGTVHVPDQLGGVAARQPNGVVIAPDGSVYVTEDYYHIIRHITGANIVPPLLPLPPTPAAPTFLTVTTNFGQVNLSWTSVNNATNYNVKRSPSSGGPYTIIATLPGTSYTDTNVLNGTTYFYVVSALGAWGETTNSTEVSATPPIPPPPAPVIGWFDYEGNNLNGFFTVLHPVSGANSFTAHNDLLIAINPTVNGLSTYYIVTNGPQPVLAVPSSTNGSTPPFYQDGLAFAQSLPVATAPDLVIKAVNVGPGGSSSVSTAEFLFQVANPTISGNNAAQFTVSDITTNVTLWYTTDGTSPTNAPPSIGPVVITNGTPATLSINANSNIIFQARAFRNGYLPSGISMQAFSPSNFVPNTISFGFASGEASSEFVASPGQTFYAPVTLLSLPDSTVYSLQFNVVVTNVSPAPPITPGAFEFASMLEKPDLDNPGLFLTIPPYMFINTNAAFVTNTVFYDGTTNFVSLLVTNLSDNLLGVGWLERIAETNLYNTLSQDLITYSQAHDDMFPNATQPNGVILGGYAFQVPSNAAPGQTYQIQIGRPSATSDGVGAPGSSVFIYAPTNNTLGGGSVNAVKNVTVGQLEYLVGNVYPFRWFNAGDFGNTNLQNADVEQVFEAAVYGLNSPAFQAPGSDFFDAMDSCGNFGTLDGQTGYYTNNNPNVSTTGLTTSQLNALFDGDYTSMDQIAFGDGHLDVCDVFVTYVRSQDPQRIWFQRFWTNGMLVAQTTLNQFNPGLASKTLSGSKDEPAITSNSSITNQPKVNFASTDFLATAGQVIQVPITANIFGGYPLRLLMLSLTVVPLDGSPALTTPVSFSYNPALGQPWTTTQHGNGNYSGVWLNNNISGLTGNVAIGTLTVTVPTNATSLSAYAIHFDHASASPNGVASFPKQTLTGLITLSSRTNSSYGDVIPDSWRLRYFLTLNNPLSQTNADADGDGMNNLQEYFAGTDPTDPMCCFKNIGTDAGAAQQPQDCVISWPSVNGKHYIIQRSLSLAAPSWTSIATNNGNGTVMEFHDTSGGSLRFYRLQVQ